MPDNRNTPIVLGLYRHDAPSSETMRALLHWLREHSMLADPLTPELSADASRQLAESCFVDQTVEELNERGDSALVFEFLLQYCLAQPADKHEIPLTAIERVVESNDAFPQELRLFTHWTHHCPTHVAYDETIADDISKGDQRLIRISVSPNDWTLPDWSSPSPTTEPPPVAERVDLLLSGIEDFLRAACGAVCVDFASVQHGRRLPTPAILRDSNDPRDFHRLYVRVPGTDINRALSDFEGYREWSLERMSGGVYFRLQDEPGRLGADNQASLNRLHELFRAACRVGG